MMDIPRLEHLFIYTTWECNLRCQHCWVGKIADVPTRLTTEAVGNAIEQAAALGLRHIKLSGGEPLLTKRLTRFVIEKAWAKEIDVSMETNGTLLNEEWADFLASHNVSVSISVDSDREEEHDAFRGLQGAFHASIRALDLLHSLGHSAGVVMSISTFDHDKIDRMIRFSAAHHAAFLKINPIVRTGRAVKKNDEFLFSLTPEEMLEIKNRYGAACGSELPMILMFPMGLSAARHILQSPGQELHCGNCPTLNLLSIMPNGDLGLCADAEMHEPLCFGNLFDQDLPAAWSSHPLLLALREVVPDQLEGVCGKCMAKKMCRGSCRAAAISEGGKLSSPHPICRWLYENKKFPLAMGSEISLS